MRPALPIALLLITIALAGCFGEKSSPVTVTAFLPINDVEPGRWSDYAFRLESTLAFKQTLGVRVEAPAGWETDAEVDEVTLTGMNTSSLVVRVRPDANASYEPAEINVFVGDTRARVLADVRDAGETPLAPGMGAFIYLSTWWENGTLASTNDPALRDRPGIASATQAGNQTFTPLRVVVGQTAPAGVDERLQDAGDGAGMRAGDTLVATWGGDPSMRALVRVVAVERVDP